MTNSIAAGKRKQAGGAQAPRLNRTTFSTSRLLDFFSEKELVAQIGHERDKWSLVAIKELLDNSLDACEEAGLPPTIDVAVTADKIVVRDNGPGIPAETLKGVIDYSVRVSNREAYVSPTRGAQGNALKTILAMPFVLDGERGVVVVESRGERHTITCQVDRIRQRPVVSVETEPAENVKNGSAVTIHWPTSASSKLQDAGPRILQLASDSSFFNPHLRLKTACAGTTTTIKATCPKWVKWLPSDPTPPDWYTAEGFDRLVSAYVAHDQDRGADRSVREFVKEFRGLTATAKQKAVLEETGLARVNLSALVNGNGLDHAMMGKLLGAMRKHSKPVKPAALGVIGRDHIATRFKALDCEMESFQYTRKTETDDDGLPVVIESAFAWRGEAAAAERRIITGVNWSPGIVNPFRTLGNAYGDGLAALLEKRFAGRDEPIVFLLHCAYPRVRYTDRGKSAVAME
jgi:DNA topoisomerase VI subunit B